MDILTYGRINILESDELWEMHFTTSEFYIYLLVGFNYISIPS